MDRWTELAACTSSGQCRMGYTYLLDTRDQDRNDRVTVHFGMFSASFDLPLIPIERSPRPRHRPEGGPVGAVFGPYPGGPPVFTGGDDGHVKTPGSPGGPQKGPEAGGGDSGDSDSSEQVPVPEPLTISLGTFAIGILLLKRRSESQA